MGTPQRRRKSKPRTAGWFTRWWPLLVGAAVTPFAVKTAEILPLTGASGLLKLQLLYPFALLLKQPQLGLPEATVDQWSQIALYAQWMVYGLYASLAIHWTTRVKAFVHLTIVHFAAFATLWSLSR